MGLRGDFAKSHPGFPLLERDDERGVERLLRDVGWLAVGERVLEAVPAGEGNMNLTLRVRTDRRSVIVKQSRPWVEKYDHIAAPFDRALVERRFYQRVAQVERVGDKMPRVLGSDDDARLLLLEDLGEARDSADLYAGGELSIGDAGELGAFLGSLHRATRGQDPSGLENRAMRRLNHEHIFQVPYDPDNGLALEELEPGLESAARALQGDRVLLAEIEALGDRYLEDGACLLHGDFFPGSWLQTDQGLRIIDPEFCFFGDPELDLGVALAHLCMARQPRAQGAVLLDAGTGSFDTGLDSDSSVDQGLVARYAGAEVIRRLIGVAQLPIPKSEGFRQRLLKRARRAVVERALEVLVE